MSTAVTKTQTDAVDGGHSQASPRDVWEKRISELINQAHSHTSPYDAKFGPFTIHIHPTVYSPRYFPETWWYAQHLPPIVNKGKFLEVGVGSGLNTVAVAASGSTVSGVDINPNAVDTTRKNLEANGLRGNVVVSDIFDNVEGRFDAIFWNHPWQYDSAVPAQLKSEKTLDAEYKLLRRFLGQAQDHLTDKGVVLLGTSAYANHVLIDKIAEDAGFAHKVLVRGQESIGDNVVEEYYIVQMKRR